MNILVAEDNEQGRYLLEQFLNARGHTVWVAPDGRAGLALCRERGAPDVIISDALMPHMDGFELCHAIRCDPRLCHVPFVLYTATYTDMEDERFARSVGVDRFVIKPVEPVDLHVIVLEVVESVRKAPVRTPHGTQKSSSFFEEHSRLISVKLEEKVEQLSATNIALAASEQSVRELNTRLLATVRRLETEVEERRQANELLRLAQQAGGVGTWSFDGASGDFLWSEEAGRILGFETRSECRSLEEFLKRIGSSDRSAVREALSRGDESTEHLAIEFSYERGGEDGFRAIGLAGRRSEPVSGRSPRCFGIVQDITARKSADARQKATVQQIFHSQKMEALGNLAGGIAHDFNNILATILFSAELATVDLVEAGDNPSVRGALSEIIHAAQRSREMIRQILTFSRRQSVERKVVPLAPVVETGLRLVRAALEKQVEFRTELACSAQALVNENQIHQVLLNLCTNAGHAMRERGGTLTVRMTTIDITSEQARDRPDLNPGSYVRIDVVDTGVGIPADVISRVFEPFFTTKGANEGTGLGLAVVHGITQAHDGFITVDSTPGKGTTFSVFLPVAVHGAGRTANAGAAPSLAARGTGQRVLVVDDEPSALRTVAQLLERLGYLPVTFVDPADARDAFQRDPGLCDLAIIDFLMPRLTGPDLARVLWKVRPDLPIILIAGFGTQIDASRARADGFRQMLAKPFSSSTLAEAIARCTNGRA